MRRNARTHPTGVTQIHSLHRSRRERVCHGGGVAARSSSVPEISAALDCTRTSLLCSCSCQLHTPLPPPTPACPTSPHQSPSSFLRQAQTRLNYMPTIHQFFGINEDIAFNLTWLQSYPEVSCVY